MGTVNFFNEDIDFTPPSINSAKEWITNVIAQEGFELLELNYIFCSDTYLHKINQSYLNHDDYTDIITFDNSEVEEQIEGDIFISVERVKENSTIHHTAFANELYRVMVHGVLHLTGYDDHSEVDIKIIRNKEDTYLKLIQ